MTNRTVWTLVAAGLLAVTWPGSARGGLIVNGDFEIFDPFIAFSPTTLHGWTFDNVAGVVENVGNPDNAARLEAGGSSNSDPTVSQEVSGLSVGTTYRLSWDLALRTNVSGSGSGRSFGVFLDNQTFADALFFDEHLSGTYESQSVDFVATSSSHTFIFAGELDARTNNIQSTDVSYNLDNVDLNELNATVVPEPPSLLLLCLGLGLVLAGWSRTATGKAVAS